MGRRRGKRVRPSAGRQGARAGGDREDRGGGEGRVWGADAASAYVGQQGFKRGVSGSVHGLPGAATTCRDRKLQVATGTLAHSGMHVFIRFLGPATAMAGVSSFTRGLLGWPWPFLALAPGWMEEIRLAEPRPTA